MTTYRITDDHSRSQALLGVSKAPIGATVTVIDKEERTKAQNNLIHKWFQQIADHRGDADMLDVKAECNLEYGRPIFVRDDPEWETVFGYIFRNLDYARKIKAIRKLDIPFTRAMTVKQLSEYMDAMQRDYREQGINLVDPEAQRYEEMAR